MARTNPRGGLVFVTIVAVGCRAGATELPGPVGRVVVDAISDVEVVGVHGDGPRGVLLGESVRTGDFDGDGHADLFVGAASWDGAFEDQGKGWVLTWPGAGLCDRRAQGAQICSVRGHEHAFAAELDSTPAAGGRFGRLVATGDLDRDGLDDLVAANVVLNEVYVWYGVADLNWDTPDTTLSGPPSVGFGLSVAGDLDGNGCSELVVGAPRVEDGRGAVYIVRSPRAAPGCGRLPRRISLEDDEPGYAARLRGGPRDFAGTSVAGAGDIDGDGYDDLIVGAPQGAPNSGGAVGSGRAWIVYGGTTNGELLGACEAPCSRDLAGVGQLGGIAGLQLTLDPADPESRGSWLGNFVAGAGDATGDGCDDVILGAMQAGRGDKRFAGAVFLVPGRCDERRISAQVVLDGSGDDYAAKFEGETETKLGQALAAAGDVNGDGIADLLLGAYREDSTGKALGETGAAYLVYGGWPGFDPASPTHLTFDNRGCESGRAWPEDLPPHLELDGSGRREAFGKHLHGGRDFDGDGLDDFVIGAPRAGSFDETCDDAFCDKGKAYIVLGESEPVCRDL